VQKFGAFFHVIIRKEKNSLTGREVEHIMYVKRYRFRANPLKGGDAKPQA
jgi:hypothetical protein